MKKLLRLMRKHVSEAMIVLLTFFLVLAPSAHATSLPSTHHLESGASIPISVIEPIKPAKAIEVAEMKEAELIRPQPSNPVNTYAPGNCTWYAYARRAQIDRPISGGWGNANAWDTSAKVAGYPVDKTPEAGAVFQTNEGRLGHVGVVEQILPDGILVSEMNYEGLYKVSQRVITDLAGYSFIH